MKRLLILTGVAVAAAGGALGAVIATRGSSGACTQGIATYPAAIGPARCYAGSEQTPQTPPDFALRDQDGRLVRLSSERGKFVLVTFLYVHCPDVCPLIAANLNEALRALGPARRSVRALAVSADPRGDTREQVRLYVKHLRLLPEFRYLIGTRGQLAPVWRAYHVLPVTYLGRKPIGHVTYVLLVDRNGKTRLLYDTQVKARDVLHDLRILMS